jgi:putative DNA primase/helicase
MVRRALFCNLDPQVERPELRKFEGDPVAMVRAERGEYIAAILTIIRAYVRAGAPKVCDPIATYGAWTRMVRGPLVWLGMPDPAASMEQARQDDPETSALRTFFAICPIPVGTEFKARDLIKRAEIDEALKEWLGGFGCEDSTKLGYWLKRKKGRVVDGRRIIPASSKSFAAKYVIEHV